MNNVFNLINEHVNVTKKDAFIDMFNNKNNINRFAFIKRIEIIYVIWIKSLSFVININIRRSLNFELF